MPSEAGPDTPATATDPAALVRLAADIAASSGIAFTEAFAALGVAARLRDLEAANRDPDSPYGAENYCRPCRLLHLTRLAGPVLLVRSPDGRVAIDTLFGTADAVLLVRGPDGTVEARPVEPLAGTWLDRHGILTTSMTGHAAPKDATPVWAAASPPKEQQ